MAAAACLMELIDIRSARGRPSLSSRAIRNESGGRLEASRPTPISIAGQLEKRSEDPDDN
jgi:hypothetical protein